VTGQTRARKPSGRMASSSPWDEDDFYDARALDPIVPSLAFFQPARSAAQAWSPDLSHAADQAEMLPTNLLVSPALPLASSWLPSMYSLEELPSHSPAHGACRPTPSVVIEPGDSQRASSATDRPTFARIPVEGVPVPSLAEQLQPDAAKQRWSRFACRFPGCGKHYASTDGVRKHCRRVHLDWLSRLNPGQVEQFAEEVRPQDGDVVTTMADMSTILPTMECTGLTLNNSSKPIRPTRRAEFGKKRKKKAADIKNATDSGSTSSP